MFNWWKIVEALRDPGLVDASYERLSYPGPGYPLGMDLTYHVEDQTTGNDHLMLRNADAELGQGIEIRLTYEDSPNTPFVGGVNRLTYKVAFWYDDKPIPVATQSIIFRTGSKTSQPDTGAWIKALDQDIHRAYQMAKKFR